MANIPFITTPVTIPIIGSPSDPIMNCKEYISWSTNGGRLIKKREKIPGYGIRKPDGTMAFQPEFDVYDATNVCPAMYLGKTESNNRLRSWFSELGSAYNSNQRLLTPSNYTLYRPSLNKPSPDDIQQGNIGNCVLEATLSAMAQKDPDFLKSGIIQDPNFQPTPNKNQYYIRFFYKNKFNIFFVKINTDIPLLGTSGSYTTKFTIENNRVIIWPSLYTKAYAIMTNVFSDFMTWTLSINDPIIREAFAPISLLRSAQGYNQLWGVNSIDALTSICGPSRYENSNTINFDYFFDPSGNLLRQNRYTSAVNTFKETLKNNICTASIDYSKLEKYLSKDTTYSRQDLYVIKRVTGNNVRSGRTSVYIVQHMYSVLSIDSNDIITLRNPWGKTKLPSEQNTIADYVATNGRCTIPLSEFVQIFNMDITEYTPTLYISILNTQQPVPAGRPKGSDNNACNRVCMSDSTCTGFVTEERTCYTFKGPVANLYPSNTSNTYVKNNSVMNNTIYSKIQSNTTSNDVIGTNFLTNVQRCISNCNANNSCVGLALSDDMQNCFNLRNGYRTSSRLNYSIWKK